MEGSDTRPYFGIEVTRRCNLRCPHCFTASGGSNDAGLTSELLEKLIGELAQSGVRSIAFSGGEPLLRQDLARLIRYGRSLGPLQFGIVTNGFLADGAKVRELAQAGLDTVQVSLDGVDAADHCSVRGCEPRDFYRALRATRAFLDAGMTVDLATILSPRNLKRAPEMAMFAEALGVRGLRYCSFVPTGRARSPEVAARYALEPGAVDKFLDFMRRMNCAPGARLQIFIDHGIGPWLESGEFACSAGRAVAYVSAEGDLYPCPGLLFDAFKVGNVLDTPISELLDHPAMSRGRSSPRAEIQGSCSNCANARCSGGCRGAAFARTGDLFGAVAYCNVARLGGAL